MEEKLRKLILDVDTGSDDAAAIICAALSEKFDILGITTVFGTSGLEDTTRHTLMITELLGKIIPVYKGCAGPLVRNLYNKENPEDSHGRIVYDCDGKRIDYHNVFDFPDPKRCVEKENAVTFLVETIKNSEAPVTIVATAALTNLGCALRIAPEIVSKIQEIVIMGGGISVTNYTLAAEANIWRDPEAAKIVFDCGARIVLIPLDATHEAAIPEKDLPLFKKINSPIAGFFVKIIENRMKAYNVLQPLGEKNISPIHDLLCVIYLLDPGVIKELRYMHVSVSLDRGESAGCLLVDKRFYHAKENVLLACGANRDVFVEDTIKLLSKTEG